LPRECAVATLARRWWTVPGRRNPRIDAENAGEVSPASPRSAESFFVDCHCFESEEPIMSTRPSKSLETFPNPQPGRDYTIRIKAPEFTCLCPKTGQPDFGTLTISYVPDRKCFELKSLKLYLQQYRNHGAFYEDVTNKILDDLVAATKPRSMKIIAEFTPRGGIRTNVIVEHGEK
jgi:7-cyano-7-deazaguanine reductase